MNERGNVLVVGIVAAVVLIFVLLGLAFLWSLLSGSDDTNPEACAVTGFTFAGPLNGSYAVPNATVTATVAGRAYNATSDDAGRWNLSFPGATCGMPATFVASAPGFRDSQTVELVLPAPGREAGELVLRLGET